MQRSGIRTAILLGSLSALAVAAGRAAYGDAGLVVASVIIVVCNGAVWFFGDRLVLRSMHAHPVGEFETPVLHRVVRDLSTAARRPMPRLYVSETGQPNAFATGRGPRSAAICCTRGLLTLLDERELRAVIAHELAHVQRRDVLVASVAAGIATAITFLSYLSILLSFDRDDEDGQGPAGVLMMAVLGPVAAAVVQLAISRNREFAADRSAALSTGDPIGLANALAKIDEGTRARPLPADPQLAPAGALMIADPFRPVGLMRLFSTHPSTAERIARLRRMGDVFGD